MKYQAVLFDLDGTVVDTLQDICNAVNVAMRRFGLPDWDRDTLKHHLGYGVDSLMRRIHPELTEEARAEMLRFYRPWYAAHSGDLSAPFEGILPMMRELKRMGLPLGIVSNKPDSALRPLTDKYFSGLVDYAAGETEGVRKKPCPDMLEIAAREMRVSLRKCLYVGDSEVDIDTSRNAGMDCVCVTWGFRTREELIRSGARTIIDRPEELISFVRSV